MPKFVNPYTFVPLPIEISRGAPTWHDRLRQDCLSGYLDVTCTTVTPLSVTNETTVVEGRSTMLPGSSLHGAIRSLHESLTGGCLRVIDTEFVPQYRDTMNLAEGRELAIVTHFDAGGDSGSPKLSVVIPSEEEVYVEAKALLAAADDDAWRVRTGARVCIDEDSIDKHRCSDPDAISFSGDGRYTLLVTDTRARDDKKNWWFVAVPNNTETQDAGSEEVSVSEGVVKDLITLIKGADDMRPQAQYRDKQCENGNHFAGVSRPASVTHTDTHGLIGYRLLPFTQSQKGGDESPKFPFLAEGQPVWITRNSDDRITEVRLSRIWRHRGSGSVAERIGDAAGCVSPHLNDKTDGGLCPSCRIFGSAEMRTSTESLDEEKAAQNSYAGHVYIDQARFVNSDGQTIKPVLKRYDFPRTEGPRPGAGQFYLESPDRDRKLPKKGERPAREWGSDYDKKVTAGEADQLRRIRGRKHYWASSWKARESFLKVAAEAAKKQNESTTNASKPEYSRVAIEPSQQFTFRVTFENLTRVDVGSLIATLDPCQWLQAWPERPEDIVKNRARMSIGGGKPFGMGVVKTNEVRMTLVDHHQRWKGSELSSPPKPPNAAHLVAEFIDATPPAVRDTWPALANILTENFVDPAFIKYPPPDREGDEFHFWKGSIGMTSMKGKERIDTPLITLPDPARCQGDQRLDTDNAKPGGCS